MARLTNRLKWRATLLKLVQTTQDDDSVAISWERVRTLNYADIGTTANDVFLSQQAKTDVVRKLQCRLDKSVSRKKSRVQIGNDIYQITRIYWDQENHMMELSLNYVN